MSLLLASSVSGVIVFSHASQSWAAFSQEPANEPEIVTSVCSTNSQAVEVEGICFETIVPQTTWRIPENEPDASTPIELGMKITNNSSTPYRFTRFALSADLMRLDRQAVEIGTLVNLGKDWDTDHPLVEPGNSETFLLEGEIRWQSNQLTLWVHRRGFGTTIINPIHQRQNYFRFIYINDTSEAVVWKPQRHCLGGFWTGKVPAQFIAIKLVNN
ncbi:MAG: hypothetical protein SW833_07695 [Cyanobacteriota bacterium]|nr:hypothetical protein [Cyanobacteriota bacterium]